MSLREAINNRSKSISVIAVLLLIAALGWLFVSSLSDNREIGVRKAFYSVDDGKTFFVADSANIPPFDHQGKQAVQAMVFSADGGKTQFVGYLMQFTERGQGILREARAKANQGPPALDPELQANTQIKKPGDAKWVSISDFAAASRITQVSAPNDPARLADPVEPQ